MDVSERRIRVVVVSPGDVARERASVKNVVDELNRLVARDRLILWRWETDARPGLNLQGPQGIIDALMDIQSADVVVGVFWKRFGTPTLEAGSGTAHELRLAWASWKKTGRPEVLVYFSTRKYAPREAEELPQWQQVLEFKRDLPKEQLWWQYATVKEFEALSREHLTRYVLELQRQERGRAERSAQEHARRAEALRQERAARMAERKRAEQRAAVERAEREEAAARAERERAEQRAAVERAEREEAAARAERERAERAAAERAASEEEATREERERAEVQAIVERVERERAEQQAAVQRAEEEEATRRAEHERALRTDAAQRSSDQRGSRRAAQWWPFQLLALGVAVAAWLAVALLPDDKPTSPANRASSTQTTTTRPTEQPRVVQQGTLKPPRGSKSTGSGETAIVNYRKAEQFKLLIAAKNLRPAKEGAAYGVWLYNSSAQKLFVGFPKAAVDARGKLEVVADLTPQTPSYKQVLLTLERVRAPTKPGSIVLSAKLALVRG